MALVIKNWSASPTPDENGNFISITGRESGILSWLLAKIGVDPVSSIEVKADLILFQQGSIEGFSNRVIPIESVSSTFYGYNKPLKAALILGAVLLPAYGLGLIVGPLYYFLNKTLTLGFVEVSGVMNGISYKRSVIEGKNISEADAKKVIEIVRTLLEKNAAK